MRNAKSKTAILVAVLVMAVLGGLSWVLLISPQFESASDIREETEAVEGKNQIDRTRVEALRQQNDKLPEYKAEIAEYQVGIPIEPRVAEFYDFIVTNANESGVFLINIGLLDGVDVKADNEPALPPTLEEQRRLEREAEEVAAAEAAAASGEPASSSNQIPLIEGFYSIETYTHVVGPRDDVFEFLRRIQFESTRHHLVSGYTIYTQEEAEAAGGMPEIEDGHLIIEVTGHIYVLADPTQPNVKDPDAEIPPLPAPNENDPFQPYPPGMGQGGTGSTDDE